jgi:hypothetical protein
MNVMNIHILNSLYPTHLHPYGVSIEMTPHVCQLVPRENFLENLNGFS